MSKFTYFDSKVALICILSSFVFSIFPSIVLGAPTVENVADNLMGPTEIITKMVVAASYIVGVGLIIFSFAQFKQHRQSPKLVPLGTPIMLLILGICAVMIPYISTISGVSFSATEQAKREGRGPSKHGAFSGNAPEVKKRVLPGPGRYTPSTSDRAADAYDQGGDQGGAADDGYGEDEGSYEDSYDDGGSGNWTQDPKYNQ